uniref:Serine-rich adhesin for platelets-like n=1 Tax=Sphaeramia orbicularis TaxID=375764 RepID=A0A673ABQ6_9TELE
MKNSDPSRAFTVYVDHREMIKSHRSSEELTESGYSSSHQASPDDTSGFKGDDNSPPFTGVFKATLVELVSDPAAPPPSPPASPDVDSPNQCDMDTLVDTLKNMGPSMRLRTMGLRGPAPVLVSSLPPIVEDAPNPFAANITDPTKMMNATGASSESVDGLYTLPADLGLKRNAVRDTRPPLELMKFNQQVYFMDLPYLNGNDQPPSVGSRLDNSIIFSSFRSASVDQMVENGKSHRSLIRAASLPETGPSNDRMSMGPKDITGLGLGTDPAGSRFERYSFLLNSSPSASGSLTGAEDLNSRLSRPPSLSLRPQFQGQGQIQDPEKNLICKYRAFPDAYLTKEKEHGKLNPRPGKMYIFDRPGMCGQRIEIRSDVVDATSWELQETISIRVVRGGWVLYEKPNFKGEKIALDEGDVEITYPFNPPEEELQNGQKESKQQNGEQNGETSDEQTESKPTRRFIIGSIRRAVRDYSVPEISLFPEENAEGKKVVFRDTSDDARIFGFPIKANSIIINAGLWLVYAKPFFQGVPRVLEVGGYTNPAAWGVEQPYVGSLHPLKVGEPRVENLTEPKMVVYEKPYFTGKSRTITTHMKDFMTRMEAQQTAFMYNVGSLKVVGGIWVGYEKAGFRGHQYLLEEGEYQDWRVWGGCDAELRSVRVIRADFTDPLMVMLEQPEEAGDDMQEENTFEVTEAIPDVELYGYKTSTRSIHVVSGAWIAYSHVDFSGSQYILEKGLYNNCADWGSEDNRICSVQPILMAPRESSKTRNEIILYREPDFQGECQVFGRNRETLPEKLLTKSCRVTGGSWVLYDSKEFLGNMYVVSEGEYPNLTSMGCPISCTIRSIKAVPMMFAVPSISLFGLECLEGKEITADTEVVSMMEEGFNNHILSVRVNSGCWVICEHSNYRGRQFLLEPIEITNWPKFSSLQTIGSMYPIRQKRCFFRIKNKERDHFMSVQGGVEELKSGRVVVTPEVEPMSDIWFYQDGLIKNKMASNMSLQVMGNVEPAAKVVLWTETRQPVQTWTAQTKGLIVNLTFPGMVLDVKGGKTYDKDHVVIMPENEERPSQQWEIVLL